MVNEAAPILVSESVSGQYQHNYFDGIFQSYQAKIMMIKLIMTATFHVLVMVLVLVNTSNSSTWYLKYW